MLLQSIKVITASILLTWPLFGMADPLAFSSGIKGGGYWSAATRLQTVAAEMGLEVQVEESKGSLHNLSRLLDSEDPTTLAFAQADALQHFFNEHTGVSKKVSILENIGQECVFIIAGADREIKTAGDLQQDKGHTLAISSPDSGTAVTYSYMTTLVPKLAATSVRYGDTSIAMGELLSENSEGVDAVMLVQRPKEHSPELDRALRNPEQFRFVDLASEPFSSKPGNTETIYQPLKLAIPVPSSRERRIVNTVCVKGLLVANKDKLLPEQEKILAKMIAYRWMEVYATDQ